MAISQARLDARAVCARRGWHHWAGPGNFDWIPVGTKACRVCGKWVAV